MIRHLFENVEVLDFCGPFEVFSVTRLNEEKRREESSPFHVFLVAATKDPGGWGTRTEMHNEPLLRWTPDRAQQVATLTSVCTGASCSEKPDCSTANGRRHTGWPST